MTVQPEMMVQLPEAAAVEMKSRRWSAAYVAAGAVILSRLRFITELANCEKRLFLDNSRPALLSS